MKLRFLLFLLLSVCQAATTIIVPPGWPYSNPIATTGPIPEDTLRVPGIINPLGYPDQPSAFVPFIGGAPQSFGTITDRNNFNSKSRLEFQFGWVKDWGYGTNNPGLYILWHGLNNTNWFQLLTVTNGLVRPAGGGINIYNSDGSLTTNRSMFGNGFNLSLGVDNFEIGDFAAKADNVLLKGLSSLTIKTPGVIAGTALVGWVPSLVDTNGLVEFAPGGGVNIYNSDGDLTGARSVNGAGFNLTFFNSPTIDLSAANTLRLASGSTVDIDGSAQIRVQNSSTTTNNYLFANINSIASGDDAVMFRVPGATGSGGEVRYDPAITYAGVAAAVAGGGQNIANANLTWTGDTAQNGDGNELDFLSFSQFNVSTSLAAGFHSNGTVDVGNPSGGKFVGGTGGINISVADTNQVLQLTTGAIIAGTATLGQVPTLIDTNGIVEFATVTGGTNYFFITYNITTNYVADNFFNADLAADASHTHDAGGFTTEIDNMGDFYMVDVNGNDMLDIYEDHFFIGARDIFISGRDDGAGNQRLKIATPREGSGLVLPGEVLTYLSDSGVEYSAINYKGTASGTPGTWILATADVIPAYDDIADPPEGTIVYARFPANSVAADTLRLGDNSADLPITKKTGIAIDANDITADQIVMFVMTGVASSAHWVCESCGGGAAPSPPANEVVEIETMADLASQTANVVISRGYYVAGDGGNAAYRLDAGSAATTNTVTVFTCDAGGQYLLMTAGAISAKQAGAVGDGVTDDHDFLQALFDATPDMAARLEPLTYRSVTGLIVPDGTRVIAHGATLNGEVSNADRGVVYLESNTKWEGGTLNCAQTGAITSGQNGTCFTIGHYDDGVGSSNVVVRSVTLSTDAEPQGNCILVTGDSHNITIEHVEVPSSATLGNAISCHWAFLTSGNPTNGTVHPFNIAIKNLSVDSLTHATYEACAVSVSGCWSVEIDNVHAKRVRYMCIATCGDTGFRYANLATKTLGSVVFKNISAERVDAAGFHVLGIDLASNTSMQEYVFDSFTLMGPNNGTGQGGAYLTTAHNATFRNGVFAGFEQGTVFTGGSHDLLFDGCNFATNRLGGFVMDNSTSKVVRVIGCKFTQNGWGLTGTNAAGVRLLSGSLATIQGCSIGNPDGEDAQEVGIQCLPPFVNATISDNYVATVVGGGVNVAYHFGAAADTGHLWLVSGNQAASGITLIAGPDQIPFLTRGKYRTFTGTATPTVGTYIVGDRVEFNEAVSTPFAKVCSVAGSSGTWVTLY